jgi:hypothetical protein
MLISEPRRHLLLRLILGSTFVVLACAPKVRGNGEPPPDSFCPGGPECADKVGAPLKAGFAKVSVSPKGYELPKPEFLGHKGGCGEGSPVLSDGETRCGSLMGDALSKDWFFDCGRDQICPGQKGYVAPDADGSEGDGIFQGFWLAGFGNSRPMNGVHDDIWARAVVMEQGEQRIAVVVVDSIGLFNDDIERMRNKIRKVTPPLDFDYIAVLATHTHEAPDTEGQWGPRSDGSLPKRGVDPDWFVNTLANGVVQSVVDASKAMHSVELTAAQVHMGQEITNLISDPRSPVVIDDSVTALKFSDVSTHETVGTWVSWGNHPETVADTNNLVTSDYPWALREYLEKRFGGTAVFSNGAIGGMMSSLGASVIMPDGKSPPGRTFAKAKAIGERVAEVAAEALDQATVSKAPEIAFGVKRLRVKAENEKLQFAYAGSIITRKAYYDPNRPPKGENTPTVDSEVAKIYVGPVRFVLVPGELFPEIAIGYDAKWAFGKPQINPKNPVPPNMAMAPKGPYLKDQLGGAMPCVLGLANDHLGYLVPPYDFVLDADKPWFDEAKGEHYEETNSIGQSVVPDLLQAYGPLMAWQPF